MRPTSVPTLRPGAARTLALVAHMTCVSARFFPPGVTSRRAGAECKRFGAIHTPAVHLTTFYSQGAPYDRALNLSASEERFRAAFAPHFSSYRAWSCAELRRVAPHVVQEFADGMKSNHGLNAVGFGAYKPYVMLDALRRAGPGEIVVFHDVNVHKYPAYLQVAEHVATVSRSLMALCGADVYMPMERPGELQVAGWVKAQVVRELGAGWHEPLAATPTEAGPGSAMATFNAAQRRAPPRAQRLMAGLFAFPLLNAHLVVARKTAAAEELLQRWLEANLHDEWISLTPNHAPHPTYHVHTPEQGVFSVLAALRVLNGSLPRDYPRYYFEKDRLVSCAQMRRLNASKELMEYALRKWDASKLKHEQSARATPVRRGQRHADRPAAGSAGQGAAHAVRWRPSGRASAWGNESTDGTAGPRR